MSISQDGNIIFIIYVKDQERSKSFYSSILGMKPTVDVPGMTEFAISGNTALGIMPEDGIVKVLEGKIPHPRSASGVPRSEIYLYVDNPEDYYNRLICNGGTGISKAARRSWGDEVSYGLDLDGHVVAFAKKA